MKLAASLLVVMCLQIGVAAATVSLPPFISTGNFDRCPGGQQWLQSRRDERRAGGSHAEPSNPALRNELIALAHTREEASTAAMEAALASASAAAADAADASPTTDTGAMADGIDAAGAVPPDPEWLSRLQDIVANSGVPTVSEIGKDGMRAFASLLDDAHSKPQFQLRAAEEILRIREPDLDRGTKRQLAQLIDRLLDDAGKPQRYGTLFEFNGQRTIVVKQPAEDAALLATRRMEAGLIPVALELCVRRDSGSADFWPFSF